MLQLAAELAQELVLELMKWGCNGVSLILVVGTVDSKIQAVVRCASAVEEPLTFYHLSSGQGEVAGRVIYAEGKTSLGNGYNNKHE